MQEGAQTVADINIQSPLNYTGGKFKLLSQIQPLLPEKLAVFYDVFCGGANVGANVKAQEIFCIDKNPYVIQLFNTLKSMPFKEVLMVIEGNIDKYELSDTYRHGYEFYGCDSSNGMGAFNKDKFIQLRKDFNQSKDILLFLTLIIFSFNNQFRFNSKDLFNIPVGKRDFNQAMRKKLKLFMEKLHQQHIEFSCQDFRVLDAKRIKQQKGFLYLDPPYLLGTATYNENNGWREQDEKDLLSFLNQCHEQKIKFALSNVVEHKGELHRLLLDWIQEFGYTQHDLNMSYNNASYQKKSRSQQSREVLITNY